MWDEHAQRSAAPLGIPWRQWRQALNASGAERFTGSLGDLRQTLRALARRCGADPGEEALAAACAARFASQRELFVLRADAAANDAHAREDDWAGPAPAVGHSYPAGMMNWPVYHPAS